MIELVGVTKKYGDREAVSELTLQLQKGEITVIIGPSGCGKTTILRMINRLVLPTLGEIRVDGKTVSGINPEELRRSMGYVIQGVGLFPHMTVAQNIETVPRLLKWPKERRSLRSDEMLSLVGLSPEEYRGKYPRQLSGGEAQRIGVARALAADPPILLMDEPFGAVDPLNRNTLQEEFLKIQHHLGKTVIFVTHDLDEAIRMADRIIVMKSGRVCQFASPEELLANPADSFVRDFVGANRALKRLSLIAVGECCTKATAVVEGASFPEDHPPKVGQTGYCWVVDREERLIGWVQVDQLLSGEIVDRIVTKVDYEEIGISPHASLKDSLSRMLQEAVGTLPVVDEAGVLIGEIALPDIQAAMGQITSPGSGE